MKLKKSYYDFFLQMDFTKQYLTAEVLEESLDCQLFTEGREIFFIRDDEGKKKATGILLGFK